MFPEEELTVPANGDQAVAIAKETHISNERLMTYKNKMSNCYDTYACLCSLCGGAMSIMIPIMIVGISLFAYLLECECEQTCASPLSHLLKLLYNEFN